MERRKVGDVMTRDVISVPEDTLFVEIVETLAENRISAVPVVGEHNEVLGIVTEADLLRKEEFSDRGAGTRPLLESPRHRRARAKATATDARSAMSTPAVVVTPDTTVAAASRRMAKRGFKHLPVVDDQGRLDGIVSRADLLRVFLRSDDDIRDEIIREVLVDRLWQVPSRIQVRVNAGVVSLTGRVELKSMIPMLIRLTAGTEGVVDVVARLGYEKDDTRPGPYAEA
ncbi:CBS domain-containing protein [Actinomadura rudentiformis]|uniref:CBS domain-containing protein n=1 Tax=Actinomadura rudentiformis TaxID=359158 RepID=A0A6H9YUQ2_9ACTN|nr:CBS domain-containing protein [Actinomadura rudentiformis]KAB2352251.1 CBS domain-containing protein [Actinomadura rudentiformis]